MSWAQRLERLTYRLAGLPIAIAGLFMLREMDLRADLRRVYVEQYWSLEFPLDWIELLSAVCILPLALVVAALGFTLLNGPIIARRCGKPPVRQLLDQFVLFFAEGMLPPWYYIFSLHDCSSLSAAADF